MLDLVSINIPEHLPENAKQVFNELVQHIDKTHDFYQKEMASLKSMMEQQKAFLKQQYRMALIAIRPDLFSEQKLALLFDEAELLSYESEDEDEAQPEAELSKKDPKPRKKKKKAIPEHFPRKVLIHDLPEAERDCEHGHGPLKAMGFDTREELKFIPATFEVLEHRYPKYSCPCCQDGVKRVAPEPVLIPKSFVSPELLAHVAISKYVNHIPLYRQEQIFARDGLHIGRQVLASWMMKLGTHDKTKALIEVLRRQLPAYGVVSADETPVKVLTAEGERTSKVCYMWQIARWGPQPIVLFNYDPSRKSSVAQRLLGDFEGYVQIDGYAGYNVLFQDGSPRIRVGCLAHCLRKFRDFVKTLPKKEQRSAKALAVIALIDKLYDIEDICKDLSGEQRRLKRLESGATEIFAELMAKVDSEKAEIMESSPYFKALNYASNELPHIKRYLENGNISPDNNKIENALRPLALGRRNWLFVCTERGAEASANIYSILVTAKLNGLDINQYMSRLISELPKANTEEEFAALLPFGKSRL